VSSLILLAVPLFILLGYLIVMTGMASAMVNFLAALVGHIEGGLAYVLLAAMLLVSGISGAKTADMAVAPVLFPDMKRRGMHEGELVSLLAASGAMAETIPASIVLIIIGSVTGVSIAALFTGGSFAWPRTGPNPRICREATHVRRRRRRPRRDIGTRDRPDLHHRGTCTVLPILIRVAVAEEGGHSFDKPAFCVILLRPLNGGRQCRYWTIASRPQWRPPCSNCARPSRCHSSSRRSSWPSRACSACFSARP
jgi:hypothetical protein